MFFFETTNLLLVGLIAGWFILFTALIWWLIAQRRPKKNIEKTTAEIIASQPVLLSIDVPKENDKSPLAAEALFASLHGIGDEKISFEVEAKEKSIRFYVWMPASLRGYVESQLYAQYPDIEIAEIHAYSRPDKIDPNLLAVSTELILSKEDFYPIKTFQNFEVDPLAAITGTLSKLGPSEHVWIQVLVEPEDNSWRDAAVKYITDVREGNKTVNLVKDISTGLLKFGGEIVTSALRGGAIEPGEQEKKKIELSPGVEAALKEIEAKSSSLGFRTNIRIVVLDKSLEAARARLQLTVGAFKQFNTNNLNSFEVDTFVEQRDIVLETYNRRMADSKHSFILNVTELASIYHLPNASVVTPSIIWAGSKKGEPPANLPLESEVDPEELTLLAKTDFRGNEEKFGIKMKDRRRHVYVIGKSGVGKSTLLKNMVIDDIREGRGVAMIDPHGEDVMDIMDYVPNSRINDVIVFDPGDLDYAIGFNMFEIFDPKYKVVTASAIVGAFKNIFGDSWGPRLEYWLKSSVLALFDYPDSTLMMVPRMFTDKDFRKDVIDKIQDPLIKARWINEWNKLDQRAQNEAISPILNKVGQFLSSSVMRNIVGQPKSSVNFREAMDNGKILLVKLSKGIIGEDNSNLLGAMIVTQFQLAAMSRADTPPAKRKDFYLYVDEFQNFATESFATILSEARKYNLSLTVANQYMSQLREEVRDAIFGNVGTLVVFRVGSDDAKALVGEFDPIFDENDLVNLNIYNVYLKLSIDGLTVPAFSAQTLPPPSDSNGNVEKIISLSRERYTKRSDFVSEKMKESIGRYSTDEPTTSRYPNKRYSNYSQNRTQRPLQDRPVPYRPAMKVKSPDGAQNLKSAFDQADREVKEPKKQKDSDAKGSLAGQAEQEEKPRKENTSTTNSSSKRSFSRNRTNKVKPSEGDLQKLISKIEKDKSSKPNLINDLHGDLPKSSPDQRSSRVDSKPDQNKSSSNEMKEDQWVSLDDLKEE